jgi:hypothetical protein
MIRWVNNLDQYQAGALAMEREWKLDVRPRADLPVLAPPAKDRRRRWDEILRTLYVPASESGPSGGLVLACGNEIAPIAECLAGRQNATLLVSNSLDAAADAVLTASESRVVVLALASQLKTRTVETLVATARLAGKQLGFLSGRTVSGLSFSVAKAVMKPCPALTGIDVFDAIDHLLDHSGPAKELAERLRRPSFVKLIRSHGEGSHAKLPGLTVCGLLDSIEFPDAPGQGCSWSERRCKRSPAEAIDVVFGHELVAPVVFFVCCNGFNFARELYPSPVSISLSLVEGWAAAVVAPIRPLIAPDAIFEAIQRQLSQGASLGMIVDVLNDLSAQLGQPNAFALHGDPQMRVLSLDTNTHPQLDRKPIRRAWCLPQSQAPDIQSWLVQLLRRAERGRRIIRSIDAWLTGQDRNATEPVATLLAKIERLAIYTLKRVEGQDLSCPDLLRATVPIRMMVRRWDHHMANLLLSMRERIDPFDLGHYDQQLIERQIVRPCRRCGTPLELYVYGAGEAEEEHRLAYLCCVCGPVSEHRQRGIALEVEDSSPSGRGGEDLLIRTRLHAPAAPDAFIDSTVVSLRFFDKARNACVHEDHRTVPIATSLIDFRFPLPETLSPDLHSIRLAAVSGFDVAYARLRFVGLPLPELSSSAVCADAVEIGER